MGNKCTKTAFYCLISDQSVRKLSWDNTMLNRVKFWKNLMLDATENTTLKISGNKESSGIGWLSCNVMSFKTICGYVNECFSWLWSLWLSCVETGAKYPLKALATSTLLLDLPKFNLRHFKALFRRKRKGDCKKLTKRRLTTFQNGYFWSKDAISVFLKGPPNVLALHAVVCFKHIIEFISIVLIKRIK